MPAMTKEQRDAARAEYLRNHHAAARTVITRIAADRKKAGLMDAVVARALAAALREHAEPTGENLGKYDNILQWLLNLRAQPQPGQQDGQRNGRQRDVAADPGLYVKNGTVFLVQPSQANPDRRYALEMLSGGKLVIASGMVFKLAEADLMPAAQIARLRKDRPRVAAQYDRVMAEVRERKAQARKPFSF